MRKIKYKKIILLSLAILLGIGLLQRKSIYKWAYQDFGFLKHEVPTIQFETEPAFLDSLNEDRDEAIDQGWLTVNKTDMVPTKVIFNGTIADAQYRLKGDYLDHIQSDKWSYRVQSSDAINGATKFSLHHPMRRNNINEFLWQFACEQEGIITLDYDIVQVKVNSTDYGLYAFEEHFGKNFCAKRNLNGFVIRYEEKGFWQNKNQSESSSKQAFMEAGIDTYNTKHIVSDTSMLYSHLLATGILDEIRSASSLNPIYFNVEKLAMYFALSDLLSGQHALVWHNLRFYMDPITQRLEPIAFDGDLNGITEELAIRQSLDDPTHWSFKNKCFQSYHFKLAYEAALTKVTGHHYVDDLLKAFKPILDKNQNILNWEFPSYEFDPVFIHSNAAFIQEKLITKKSPSNKLNED